MNQRKLLLVILLFLTFASAYVGVGLSYPKILSPLDHHGYFTGIHHDRWISNNAEIELPNLLHRGNRVDLHFKNWHPESKPAPNVSVSVCDREASRFIAKKGSTHSVYLKGDCEPRSIRINSINSFQIKGRDLIAQLDYLEVSSKFGFVLPSFSSAILPFILLLVLISVLYFSFKTVYGFLLGLFVLLCAPQVMQGFYFNNTQPLVALYIFCLLLFVGFAIANKVRSCKKISFIKNKSFYVLLVIIFAFAALLRFYSIDFGLPANYHPDEVPKYNAIMRMRGYGDLNPRYFLHPTLLLYSTYFSNEVFRLITSATGAWDETLIFAGRLMSASAGSISVVLTALIGKRLFNKEVGLFSGLLLAVFPLHVTCSRYVKEDALLTFYILLSVYFVIRAVQQDKVALLLLAGVFAGFSAGVKYSGLISVMILVGAPFIKSNSFVPDRKYLKWTVRAIAIIPIGFLITTPYALLDLGRFIHDFEQERAHMSRGHSAAITSWSQLWMYHFGRSLYSGVQSLPLYSSICGIGYLLYKFKMKGLYLIALFLLYYIPAEYVTAKPAPQPERYIMPCQPFLAIISAYFLYKIFSLAKNSVVKVVICIIIAATFAQPLVRSVNLASELGDDTRKRMKEWMVNNLEKGSTVLVDWKPYSPRFFDDEFNVVYLNRAEIITELGIENLLSKNADYLVLSSLFYDRYFSQPNTLALHREQINQVFRKLKTVKQMEAKYGTYGFNNPKLVLFDVNKDRQ